MPFLNILTLYLIRIYLTWFGITVGGILFIISVFEGTELLRRAVGRSYIPFTRILEMILLSLPGHFQVLLPFLVFITTLIVFWRLNQTHELIIIRSVGISVWQMVGTFLGLALTIGVLNLTIMNPLSSAMNARRDHLNSKYFNTSPYKFSVSESGVWLRESYNDRQIIINAHHMDLKQGIFYNGTFYIFDKFSEFKERLDADKIILKDQKWHLESVHKWDKKNIHKTLPIMILPTHLTIEKIQNSYTNPETISFWKLPKFIALLEESGMSSLSYRLYWHSQISKLGLMIALILVSVVFSLHPIRQGRTGALLGMAFISGFLVHFMSDIIYAYGLSGRLPVILAAWASPLLVVLLSSSALLRLEDG